MLSFKETDVHSIAVKLIPKLTQALYRRQVSFFGLAQSLYNTSSPERPCLQARLANTQTVQDLLKLTETLQHEKSRLQSREQKDAADTLKLQQALSELRAAHSMVKVGRELQRQPSWFYGNQAAACYGKSAPIAE